MIPNKNFFKFQSHPEVVNAAKEALDKYGAGLSSVRFICGTQVIRNSKEGEKI
jgi:glycine C-acetyltransferase